MKSMQRSVGRYVGKLSNKVRRRLHAFSFRGEFSPAEGRALHFILAQPVHEDLFQKDIEEEYSLRPSSATELLKKMEKDGLIRREATEYDARLKKIIVSEKALDYKDQVMEDLRLLEEDLTRGIDPADLDVFFSVIEKMIDNIS